jgi:hypothetical protein
LRRPGGVRVLVLDGVDELLDLPRRFEGAQGAEVCGR